VSELNEYNPLLKRLHQDELWMKLCAVLTMKLSGTDGVPIDSRDLEKLEKMFNGERPVLTIQVINQNTKQEAFFLRLMREKDALDLEQKSRMK
jgi:hypothetical protein